MTIYFGLCGESFYGHFQHQGEQGEGFLAKVREYCQQMTNIIMHLSSSAGNFTDFYSFAIITVIITRKDLLHKIII